MPEYYKYPLLVVAALALSSALLAQTSFSTNYFKIQIDRRGYITSMRNITTPSEREFSPADKPSPLLSLYSTALGKYYFPH